jgi:RimJ/RimL family protein N-acetyltransferase
MQKKYGLISAKIIRQMKALCNKVMNETLSGFKEHDVVLALSSTGKVAGFCFISPSSPEAHFGTEATSVYLYNYMTDPAHRANGVSAYLMGAIKRLYARRLNLDCLPSNERGRAFFERSGFQKIGEYHQPRQDVTYLCYSYFPDLSGSNK